MSATFATPPPATLDVSGTPRVPLGRLVLVELRKMIDTRAGMWLMITAGLITVPAVILLGFLGSDNDVEFGGFIFFSVLPQAFLLPVLGILLVTQEWGQRTAMVTFTLEPHRGRVLNAKILAAVVVGLAAMVAVLTFASLATLVFAGPDGFTGFSLRDFGMFALLQTIGVLQGVAFGLLFLNSAAAIVVYFVLPNLITIVANVWSKLHDAAPWIDFQTAQEPLFSDGGISATEWAHFASAGAIWLLLPIVIGAWRMLRAELK